MTRNKEIEVTYRNSFGDMTPKTIITTGMDTTSVKKLYKSLGYQVIHVVYKRLIDSSRN